MPDKHDPTEPKLYDAPERDGARHSLTIEQTAQLFADLGVPRSKRSIQRFCQQGHLDCIRVASANGDKLFINQQSAERYAEELRQIETIANMNVEARHDAPEHDAARQDATQRDIDDVTGEIKRLENEVFNLRIDSRAKEQVINFLTEQAHGAQQQLQDVSYRLGVAESRVLQLEAPKADSDTARHDAPEHDTIETVTVVEPVAPTASENVEATSTPKPTPSVTPARRSFFGRLLG